MPTAPERFCIIIEGSVARVRERYVVDDGRELGHYLKQLVVGVDMPSECWRAYGLRVTIDEDTDQAD